MSGPKAYTMKEMKGIVEYLVEHKAYGEIRGRKMWVDYANSSLTTRTWQSLKETFLKRILPDIQNPYYQLTRDQVCSFKQGVDVQAKEKNNRLEIRTVSEESTNNAEKVPDIEQPSTSAEIHNDAEKTLGEEIKSATITVRNRSSADTFIIEGDESRQSRDDPPVSKKTTAELLEELGEPSKSLKECLNYESLPCIVKKVLEDFETESEGSDKELQMQIVEDIPEDIADQEVFVIEDTENLDNVEFIQDERIVVEGGVEVDIGPTLDHEIVTEVTTTDLQGLNNWLEGCAQTEQEVPAINESNESIVQDTVAEQTEDTGKNKPREEPEPMTIEAPENIEEKPIGSENNNQSSLSATSDTIIPNNQEVLDATKSQKTNSKFDILAPLKDASRKRSTSTDKTETKKQKLDDRVETKTNGDVIDVTPSTNNTEAIIEALKKSDKIDVTQAEHIDELAHNKNPCLKSVSLFEEQFNTTKYSDSEEDTPMPINKEKTIESTVSVSAEDNQPSGMKDALPSDKIVVITDPLVDKKQKETIETEPPAPTKQIIPKSDPPVEKKHDDIDQSTEMHIPDLEKQDFIVLMANSDSDIQQTPPSKRPQERFKHLEQAFGFVPGTSKTAAQRGRSLRSRNRTKSQRTSCTINEDSDWEDSISEPELADDFIAPPRGRRERHARKYRKPKSGRLVAMGEERTLFLLNGNRIFPIVNNGKPLTYVAYDSFAASEEEEELMWKQKYIDEKKKAAALKRQLEEFQDAGNSRSKSPIFPNHSRNVQSINSVNQTIQIAEADMNKQIDIKHAPGGKIQIILSKNNEESVNLQGQWPEVLPVVQNLMSMFYKTDDTSIATKPTEPTKEDISGLVTPIIQILDKNERRKVDDLESVIFKEIEDHAKTDETQTSNVTKRKVGRPKKTPSTSSEHSEKSETTAKRPRRSKLSLKHKTANTENIKITDETKTNASKASLTERLSVESVQPVNEKPAAEDKVRAIEVIEPAQDNVVDASVNIPVVPRVTRSRKSGNETDSSTRTTRLSARANDNDDDIRYMFPPGPKSRRNSKLTPNKRSSENPHETSQGDLRYSVDSTQGYQDSDASPAKVNITKRKKKLSITVKKGKYAPRRKSVPTISIHDVSLESSNSSYFIPKKSRSQSSLDSEIYKTESYQILMGNRKLSLKKLDVIDETSKSDDLRPFNTLSKESSNNSNMVLEVGSSSNVSLPLSPELSVVENLSISREMIQSDNHPTINEIQANDSVVSKIYNQYLMSDVDVTIPLMQQDCELLNTHGAAKSKVKKQKTPIKVSDLLKKVPVVNMSINNTLSDTLDRKLRDLLLESAKKISDSNKENMMDVDESNVVEPKKTKGKKRCSTPRKRASTKKNKPPIGPVIDEHMESCSRGGRISCPPVITYIPVDENANNSADVQINAKPKPKPKVKKNIIKVKIQRPKGTTIAKAAETAVGNTSQMSVYTDSGINETASISEQFFQGDSVELIHNHSETCLLANECIGNSIEFVENSKSESVVSVNSTTSLECELLKVMEDVEILSGGYRRRNAQDTNGEKSSGEIFGTPTETIYHSPIANCSLLTDDLSDEIPIPSTKWYLFSEEDTNNTNLRPDQMTSNTRVSNFAANLKQLFPITCAVPDLSTISELSKENEGSKKGFDTDGDTGSSDYQSLV